MSGFLKRFKKKPNESSPTFKKSPSSRFGMMIPLPGQIKKVKKGKKKSFSPTKIPSTAATTQNNDNDSTIKLDPATTTTPSSTSTSNTTNTAGEVKKKKENKTRKKKKN
jgi:hypothetical protein